MPKPARTRVKACEHCHVVSNALYRVVHDSTGKWVLICEDCRIKVENQPLYRYGGTWKADKRH